MALSVSTQVNPVAGKLIVQSTATGTADNNVTGAAATLYMVDVDNSLNGGEVAYLKLYNDAAPVVGTTAPDMVIMLPAATRRTVAFPEGLAFATALSMACVTTGGTSGTTDLGSAVVVRILSS